MKKKSKKIKSKTFFKSKTFSHTVTGGCAGTMVFVVKQKKINDVVSITYDGVELEKLNNWTWGIAIKEPKTFLEKLSEFLDLSK